MNTTTKTIKRIAITASAALALLAAPAWAQYGPHSTTYSTPSSAPATTLGDGSTVALSGASDSARHFRLYVPTGLEAVEITASGGRGDLDLYVRYGAEAGTKEYTARSIGGSTSERISLSAPRGGWWHILAAGYRTYAGATLRIRFVGGGHGHPQPTSPTVLRGNVPLGGISAARSGARYFQIEIPRGTDRLTVATSGGNGDADLYLRQGALPERKSYHHKSEGSSARESITVARPAAGTWFVMLYAYSDFRDVTIQAAAKGATWHPEPRHEPHHGPRTPLAFTNPAPGEVWYLGDTATIRWQASRRVRRVRFQLSTNNGANWRVRYLVPEVQASAGSVNLSLGDADEMLTTAARVRAVDLDTRRILAISPPFTIARRRRPHGRGGHGGHGRPRPTIVPAGPDAYEGDNSYDDPAVIRPERPQRHTISPRGDVDYIRFDPAGGRNWIIRISGVTAGLKGTLWVRRKNQPNRQIASFRVGRPGAVIPLAPDSKTYWYTLRLESEDGAPAAYTVTVTKP